MFDEPSNYLDRDSLAMLANGLKEFEGGVVVISHSAEFTDQLCKETWTMDDGTLTPQGNNWIQGQGTGARIDQDQGPAEDMFDAMGNVIKQGGKVKMTRREILKKKKERAARRKRGEDVSDWSQDDE